MSDKETTWNGDNSIVRQSPPKLLRDLVAHGFRAFCIIRTKIHVYKSPAMLVRDLRAETVYVVVIAVNANDARAVDLSAQYLGRFEIGGNEDAGLEASACRLCRDRVGQVAGRRATHHVKAKVPGLGQRYGNNSVFET